MKEPRTTTESDFLAYRDSGDVAAIERVFDALSGELFGLARKLTRDAVLAEDVVQETFLVAIKRAHRWEASRPLAAWMVGILVNKAHKARRRSSVGEPTARELGYEHLDGLQSALNSEVREEVQRALKSLSPADQALLDAVLHQQQKPAELARQEGITSGAMRARLHRAMDRLRNALPASLAWGLSMYVGTRGQAAVREAVGESAKVQALSATGAAVGLGSLAWWLQPLQVAATVVVLLLGWYALPSSPDSLNPNQGLVVPSDGSGDEWTSAANLESAAIRVDQPVRVPRFDAADSVQAAQEQEPSVVTAQAMLAEDQHWLHLNVSGIDAGVQESIPVRIYHRGYLGPQKLIQITSNGPHEVDVSEFFPDEGQETKRRLLVVAKPEGFLPLTMRVDSDTPRGETAHYYADLELLRPQASIRAQLTLPEGVDAKDCRVGVYYEATIGAIDLDLRERVFAKPEASGSIALHLLRRDPVRFFVEVPGYPIWERTLDLTQEAHHDLGALTLDPGATISGRIWVGGQPLPEGYRVQWTPADPVWNLAGRAYSQGRLLCVPDAVSCDAQGYFSVTGLQADYRYDAYLVRPRQGPFPWHPAELGHRFLQVVPPSVDGEYQSPLALVTIQLMAEGKPLVGTLALDLPEEAHRLAFVGNTHKRGVDTIRTALDGTVVLGMVPGQPHSFTARGSVWGVPGDYGPESFTFQVPASGLQDPLVFELSPADTSEGDQILEFELVGAGAQAMEGMEASITFQTPGRWIRSGRGLTVQNRRVRMENVPRAAFEATLHLKEPADSKPEEWRYGSIFLNRSQSIDTTGHPPGHVHRIPITMAWEGRVQVTLGGLDPSLPGPELQLVFPGGHVRTPKLWAVGLDETGHRRVTAPDGPGPFTLDATTAQGQYQVRIQSPHYQTQEVPIQVVGGECTRVHFELVPR